MVWVRPTPRMVPEVKLVLTVSAWWMLESEDSC